ncbi:MAG: YkgJ family cysteine cluster protein [Thermomonas sp.]|nr:YkgJ family cysteine cluster protein [Thermomonas sp.]
MRTPPNRIHLVLRIDGEAVPVSAPRPPLRARLDELLPAQRAVDNAAIDHAVRKAAAAGKQVTCAKGCSACCRAQPVPVTPAEAYALLRLVEALPAARRDQVEARFDDRVQRLRGAGLADLLLDRADDLDAERARGLALAYFKLGLVCPFLAEDACSIHPQRPFVCRQYLVSSDPALCADPFANHAEVIPMPLHAATAALAISETAYGRAQHSVPLTLALEYARRHRAELERQFDAEPLFRQWLGAL